MTVMPACGPYAAPALPSAPSRCCPMYSLRPGVVVRMSSARPDFLDDSVTPRCGLRGQPVRVRGGARCPIYLVPQRK